MKGEGGKRESIKGCEGRSRRPWEGTQGNSLKYSQGEKSKAEKFVIGGDPEKGEPFHLVYVAGRQLLITACLEFERRSRGCMSKGTQGFSLNENGWSTGCSYSLVLTSANKELHFRNVEPSCVIMQHTVCTDVSGAAQWYSQHREERCHRKTKQHTRNGLSRQCWIHPERWMCFEQAKVNVCLHLHSFILTSGECLLQRYAVKELLQEIVRNVQHWGNVFPHILVSLLSEGTFD